PRGGDGVRGPGERGRDGAAGPGRKAVSLWVRGRPRRGTQRPGHPAPQRKPAPRLGRCPGRRLGDQGSGAGPDPGPTVPRRPGAWGWPGSGGRPELEVRERMEGVWLISYLALWGLTLLLALVVLVHSRLLGLLHHRFGPAHARPMGEGPALGTRLERLTGRGL